MNKTSYRIDYIDVFRGLGILTMVMGHVGFGDLFQHFIHAFHMPMFFFVSGFFYKRQSDIKQIVKKKCRTLLIPYVGFGVMHLCISILLKTENIKLSLYHLLWENTKGLPIAGALWFLTALFLTELIFAFLDKCIKNKYLLSIVVIFLVFLGSEATNLFEFRLPWGVDAALVGLGFYMLGFLMKTYKETFFIVKILNLKVIPLVVSIIVCSVLILLNGYINMREGTYAILPFTFFNAMLAIVIGINIAKQITNLNGVKFLKWFLEWTKGIGRNSIVYLCLNQVVIMMCLWIVQTMNCSFYVGKIVELILVLLLLYVCQKIYVVMRTILYHKKF